MPPAPSRSASRRLRAGLALVAAALAAGTVVGPSSPAGAQSVSQTFTVPASGSFTVVGHGFGHGHGMSQYGANGAARKGLTHQRILAFYYPGTTLSTAYTRMRVLITADTTRDVVVVAKPQLKVRDLGTGTLYDLPTNLGATRWRLDVSGTKTVVDYRSDAWHRWKPGGRATFAGDGEFVSTTRTITLALPGGTLRTYRGFLRAASPSAGSSDRDTVNVVSLDSYVRGVVPAEMPPSWSPEAVQAQAVAARTYAMWSRDQHPSRYYQICDTTACQVYKGMTGEYKASNDAVVATSRQVLTYQGKPAFTQFSSSSGGRTSAGSVAYLPSKADPYDDWSGNAVHDWTLTVSESALEKRFPKIGDLRTITVTGREGGGDWGGRVWTMTLKGSAGTATMSGSDFRSLYGLRSTYFWFRA